MTTDEGSEFAADLDLSSLLPGFRRDHLNEDRCFLCGTALDSTNRTVEHVFPKWFQNRMNLWDKRINLLNGTSIPYRQLVIPCCTTCNSTSLAALEAEVEVATQSGRDGFLRLDETKRFQWLSKIYYGLLFRELSLLLDRTDREAGTIISAAFLEEFASLHMHLQSINYRTEFDPRVPWSCLVIDVHRYPVDYDFDYIDSIELPALAIRFDGIGIIAMLGDGGAVVSAYEDIWQSLDGVRMHPIQWDEMFIYAFFKAYSMNRTPKFISVLPSSPEDVFLVTMLPLQGLSSKPIFDDWEPERLASALWQVWQRNYDPELQFETVYPGDGLTLSMTFDHDRVIRLDADMNRIAP